MWFTSYLLQTTMRVWDVLFNEGASILFIVALAIFKVRHIIISTILAGWFWINSWVQNVFTKLTASVIVLSRWKRRNCWLQSMWERWWKFYQMLLITPMIQMNCWRCNPSQDFSQCCLLLLWRYTKGPWDCYCLEWSYKWQSSEFLDGLYMR